MRQDDKARPRCEKWFHALCKAVDSRAVGYSCVLDRHIQVGAHQNALSVNRCVAY